MKRFSFFGIVLLCLFGCAPKIPVVTTDIQTQMISNLKNGTAVLDCNFGCSGSWIFSGQHDAYALYGAQDWQGLATKVMQFDYQNDITYFYLGIAAENLGAYDAALKYYQIAGALSTGSDPTLRCSGDNTCQSFSFPADLYPRIQAVQDQIAAEQAAAAAAANPVPVIHHHYKKKPAAPAPVQWITPPPVTH